MCHSLPHNAKALELTEQILQQLPGECNWFASVDSAVCDSEDKQPVIYPHEVLHNLTPSGMPPRDLNLKFDALVMLFLHLNIKEGLYNGTCKFDE